MDEVLPVLQIAKDRRSLQPQGSFDNMFVFMTLFTLKFVKKLVIKQLQFMIQIIVTGNTVDSYRK